MIATYFSTVPHCPIPTPAVIRHLRQEFSPSSHPPPSLQPQKISLHQSGKTPMVTGTCEGGFTYLISLTFRHWYKGYRPPFWYHTGIVFRSVPPLRNPPPPLRIIRWKEGGVGEALLGSSLVNLLQLAPGESPLTSTSLIWGGGVVDLLTGEVAMAPWKAWGGGRGVAELALGNKWQYWREGGS